MKDRFWLVEIAIRFCTATNEIGSLNIHEYEGFKINWSISDREGTIIINRGLQTMVSSKDIDFELYRVKTFSSIKIKWLFKFP